MSLRVPIAHWFGKPVFPPTVQRCQTPLACPSCTKPVYLRRGTQKRAHFAHKATCKCGESLKHYATKHWIAANVTNPEFTIYQYNDSANEDHILFCGNPAASCKTEVRVQIFGKVYIVDAMIYQNNVPIVAVEVKHTHAAGANKLRHLSCLNATIIAVEVEACDLNVHNYVLQFRDVSDNCYNWMKIDLQARVERRHKKIAAVYFRLWRGFVARQKEKREIRYAKRWLFLFRVKRLVYWIKRERRARFATCAGCFKLVELYRLDAKSNQIAGNSAEHGPTGRLYHTWCLPVCTRCGDEDVVTKGEICDECTRNRRPCVDCRQWKYRDELNGFYDPHADYDTTFVCCKCRVRCRQCMRYISKQQACFGGKCYGCNRKRKCGDDDEVCECGREKQERFDTCYICTLDTNSASESDEETTLTPQAINVFDTLSQNNSLPRCS